ncbi:hypothetical protein EIP91_009612 [Steccherinum ochraceum]|uniref:Uncharacterized protein n=1 Tax=Steccherinum ochraceum TaxID=92696 RepID=A0A4R0RE65_9APHY|nr:hypothetical protein EIP91_009612 [Steccherinum ochraceum]
MPCPDPDEEVSIVSNSSGGEAVLNETLSEDEGAVSDATPSITSVSELARSSDKWDAWAIASRIFIIFLSDEQYQPVYKKIDTRYPYQLQSMVERAHETVSWFSDVYLRDAFIRDLHDWVVTPNEDQPTFDPEMQNFDELSFLLALWSSWRYAHDTPLKPNEATERTVLKTLLKRVFQGHPDRIAVLSQESIAIPQPFKGLDFDTGPATVDTLVVGFIPAHSSLHVNQNAHLFDAMPLFLALEPSRGQEEDLPPRIYLGLLAVEVKCEDVAQAKRRICTDIAAILYHRRALRLEDRVVHGLTFVKKKVRLYVGFWEGDGVRIGAAMNDVWDFNSPRDFVKFYFYLRGMKTRLDQQLDADIGAFDAEKLVAEGREKASRSWRKAQVTNKRSREDSAGRPRKKRKGTKGWQKYAIGSDEWDESDDEQELASASFATGLMDLAKCQYKESQVTGWVDSIAVQGSP